MQTQRMYIKNQIISIDTVYRKYYYGKFRLRRIETLDDYLIDCRYLSPHDKNYVIAANLDKNQVYWISAFESIYVLLSTVPEMATYCGVSWHTVLMRVQEVYYKPK